MNFKILILIFSLCILYSLAFGKKNLRREESMVETSENTNYAGGYWGRGEFGRGGGRGDREGGFGRGDGFGGRGGFGRGGGRGDGFGRGGGFGRGYGDHGYGGNWGYGRGGDHGNWDGYWL